MNSEGGKLLQMYLMASYAYYKLCKSIMPDETFDKLCVKLYNIYDTFEHPHKHLVSKEDLKAGTGYAISRYPLIVQHATYRKLEELGL